MFDLSGSSKGQMWQRNSRPCEASSFRESIKALEADIHHANSLASTLPRDYCGDCVQMRLSYSPFAPLFLFFIEWMDYSCTDALPGSLGLLQILVNKVYVDGIPTISSRERKTSVHEFYAIIYPSLKLLEDQFNETKEHGAGGDCLGREPEKDEECGICMESKVKMILPSCGHSMCINCFHNWNIRSQSCPYCRGSLKRVNSMDLWVLTGSGDVVDPVTLAMDSLRRFYLYIESLPTLIHDKHILLLDYMI